MNLRLFIRVRSHLTAIVMPMKTTKVILSERPNGIPAPDNFKLSQSDLPSPASDEVVLRNLFVSPTPGDRLKMNRSIDLGDTVPGYTIAEVVESGTSGFAIGQKVISKTGWCTYAIEKPENLTPLNTALDPITLNLGVVGPQGLCAYFGLFDVGRLTPGEVVLVSGASGAIGSAACQLAKAHGCKVIALTDNSPEKLRWLQSLGLDIVVADFETLKKLHSERIDVFFDNVGGAIFQNSLDFIKYTKSNGARIVCCGMVSGYNAPPGSAPFPITNLHTVVNLSLAIRGFILSDFKSQYSSAIAALERLAERRQLRQEETVFDGIENAATAFIQMMRRQTIGKTLVKLTHS